MLNDPTTIIPRLTVQYIFMSPLIGPIAYERFEYTRKFTRTFRFLSEYEYAHNDTRHAVEVLSKNIRTKCMILLVNRVTDRYERGILVFGVPSIGFDSVSIGRGTC